MKLQNNEKKIIELRKRNVTKLDLIKVKINKQK